MSKKPHNFRRLGVFLLLGVAVGTGVRYYIESRSRAHRDAPLQPLIDWDQALKIALKVSQWEKAPLKNRAFRQEQYQRMVERSEPLISRYLGVQLPQPISQVSVINRREWLEVNFASFERLFAPIEKIYHDHVGEGSILKSLVGSFNSRMLGAQVGGLLGFMAQRVLGQYDLSLLSPDPGVRGVLYYVEPNIALIQQNLGLNDEEFRLWIALHETTHVFEFEAYPWVRDHFNDLLQQYFDHLGSQIDSLGGGLAKTIARVARNISSDRHWVEMVLTPEQRQIFDQIQAMMSLAEGYSNHIMNAIGRQILPSFDMIEQRMEQRQQSKTRLEQLFYRITGLDLKMAQYKKGEAFVNAVVRERGIGFASRAWERAEHIPTMQEIDNPHEWIARMDRG